MAIDKGPPSLGILLGPSKGEPPADPHADHDQKHRLIRELAELFGAKLDSQEEERACEILGAFIDEHEAEEQPSDKDDDEEDGGESEGEDGY